MTWRIWHGDALRTLPLMPENHFHTCVTSPPYYGLRSYLPAGHLDKDKEIGTETSPDEYVQRLVEVFRGVRRTLRDDGTLWLNLGNSFARRGGTQGGGSHRELHHMEGVSQRMTKIPEGSGLKSKDLIPIAWMVGLALQRDGWWLRADNIWEKPSVMPFSGTDRTTISHEYLLLLSKRERYYYDAFAIREPAVYGDHPRNGTPDMADIQAPGQARQSGLTKLRRDGGYVPSEFRNKRSVWTIPSQGFDEDHFAAYPPALVEPCILAGTSERGCCATCGAPWKRLLERRGTISARGGERKHLQTMARAGATSAFATGEYAAWETAGWKATCACGVEPVPCRVLDPFSGAGTTVMVARRLGRAGEGIELSAEYVKMSERRILEDAPLLNRTRGDTPCLGES